MIRHDTILLVDDEPPIIELAQLYLENEDFAVETAGDGEEALAKIERGQPTLVVLDLMLPKLNGWEVCKRVRATSSLPIIMLTARIDDIDKIVGLELGADDYMTKPFNPRELVARVKAVLRRGYHPKLLEIPDESLNFGGLTINLDSRQVMIQNKHLDLRAKEFDLLLVLAQHIGQVLSREQLLDLVWGFDFYGETRTVDVHIAHLRKKLGQRDVIIETVWGIGYKFLAA